MSIQALDVDALAPGTVHHLDVELGHDGLGRAVEVPVMVARGRRPGPVLGLTAALHGNELNGIPVIHGLFRRLDPEELRGTVVGVVATNVPGLLEQTRAFPTGTDLNHIFPGKANGNAAEVYVHRLLDRVVSKFNVLLDLHTASFGRVNSLYVRADMSDPVTARLAHLQRPQIIVHNPPHDQTLRGTASLLGIPAVTVEIGNPHRYHRRYIRRSLTGVRQVLGDRKMLRARPVTPGAAPVICARSYWLYTDHGGLLDVVTEVTQRVTPGQIVAVLRDAFGNVTREYTAPEHGIVIGHSVNPVASTGARILHIGVLATEADGLHPRPESV